MAARGAGREAVLGDGATEETRAVRQIFFLNVLGSESRANILFCGSALFESNTLKVEWVRSIPPNS
jgi:hypothetical protein